MLRRCAPRQGTLLTCTVLTQEEVGTGGGRWRLVCLKSSVHWKWQPGCILPRELRWLMNEQVLWSGSNGRLVNFVVPSWLLGDSAIDAVLDYREATLYMWSIIARSCHFLFYAGWLAGLRRWCCHAMSKWKTQVTSCPLCEVGRMALHTRYQTINLDRYLYIAFLVWAWAAACSEWLLYRNNKCIAAYLPNCKQGICNMCMSQIWDPFCLVLAAEETRNCVVCQYTHRPLVCIMDHLRCSALFLQHKLKSSQKDKGPPVCGIHPDWRKNVHLLSGNARLEAGPC